MMNPIKKLVTFAASALLFVATAAGAASCGQNSGPQMTDYVHGNTVRLKLDYRNHNFFEDGIGQVNVLTYIDGDTTHFTNVYGDTTTTLKSRYYGIDTPESTGAVQPFGKKASKYTKEKLQAAAENGTIVVSSPFSTAADGGAGRYAQPETDSTGSRYLSLVWINETVKNAPVESLVLLNLWIVQDGLSWAKNTSEVPAYQETFSAAMNQAEKFVLGVWQEVDPDYDYGSYKTASLYEIKEEVNLSLTDPEHVNKFNQAKVRITGVVAGFTDRMLYIQEKFVFLKSTGEAINPDDMDVDHPELYDVEWAGINVFTGMTPISSAFTKVGTYLEVCGNAEDSETFGFQITGTQGHWPATLEWEEGDGNCKILLTAEQNDGVHALYSFEYTLEEMNAHVASLNGKIESHDQTIDVENLYCRTSITNNLICSGASLNAAKDEITVDFEGLDVSAYLPFRYAGNPEDAGDLWIEPEKLIGKTFSVDGVFSFHKSKSGNISFQIVCCSSADMPCLTDKKGTVRAEPLSVEEACTQQYIENVSYFVKGKIASAEETRNEKSISEITTIGQALPKGDVTSESYYVTGTIKSIDTEWDSSYANLSFTMTAGGKDLKVYRGKIYSGLDVDGSKIVKGKQVAVQGQVKNFNGIIELENAYITRYDTKALDCYDVTFSGGTKLVRANCILVQPEDVDAMVEGSTLTLFGVPTTGNDYVSFDSTAIISVLKHGQTLDDALTPEEATAVANALDAGETTEEVYYIYGTVKEITSPYDTGTKRISFVITLGGHDFLVTDAKFSKDVNYEDLVVGKYVVIRSKLIKTADGTLTTQKQSCQVQVIEDQK